MRKPRLVFTSRVICLTRSRPRADLVAPGHERRDLRDIKSAVRKGWKIPDVLFNELATQMGLIVKNGTNREKTQAAQVLLAMHESNERRQTQVVEHHHAHAIVPVTVETFEQARAAILRRIAVAGGAADDP